MEQEFRDRYKVEMDPHEFINTSKQKENRNKRNKLKERYTAPKGTAKRYKLNKKKFTTRIVALILAGAIGINGGISLANNRAEKAEQAKTLEEVQELGIDINSLGISEKNLDKLEEYKEYFDEFNPNNQYELSDEKIIYMADEIEQLHLSIVKEKMAKVTGTNAENIDLSYVFEKADGVYKVKITVQDENYNKEIFNNTGGFLGIGEKNQIPDEMVNAITAQNELETLRTDVQTDKISKVNAVKELKRIYKDLSEFASGELVKDKKGNISVLHFTEKDRVAKKDREER